MVEELCGCLGRPEKYMGPGVPPGPSCPHEQPPNGAGPGVGEADPVLSLLQNLSARMTPLEERAGSSQDSPVPGPAMAHTTEVVPFMCSLDVDLALPSTSSAHLAQFLGTFGSL